MEIKNIQESIAKDELVVIVGTGVSISLTNNEYKQLSWAGLVESGFSFGGTKGKISTNQIDFWKNQLQSDDIDDLLSAAEFVGRKLGAPNGDLYARWLSESFAGVVPKNAEVVNSIESIARMGIPICTLNYDSLLESVTGLPSIALTDTRKTTAWMRREETGILHLHGCWQQPDTCVLGIRDYDGALNSEARDLFQRHLSSFKRLLFIGCGDTFADPNFSALIGWLRSHMGASALQHYALVSEHQCELRHADPAWIGFVDPLSFGAKYTDLPIFLNHIFGGGIRPATSSSKTKRPPKVDRSSKLLENYREFLVRDCGQMTIEGVRADMDTAQRRFDLERLFVPLELVPCPPDVSLDDPSRLAKLTYWKRKKSEDPQSFGNIFSKTKGLALLALPGGGKSLLLKRLAVAYASPDRRSKSDDNLPDIDLTPVLIRCREWRAYIKLPIATLLKSLPDITGQPDLAGLNSALIPLFKQGKVLLLVDGLDEIHDDADRTVFVENLRAFLDQYQRTKLVVTSREAGFNLVAPYLAEYCEQWRVAPLSSDAIRSLSSHWHKLMVGGSPEAIEEAHSLSQVLTSNDALRRLAENPLLLTMLLVVKHGAGRLPPDRVSLYGRAVEVLLDTWNIKGHEALNTKEAIPQLSYIAYELMKEGKQTATERELLLLLEKARENVPQISRYAKDTPFQFLKRVELRSSLLLEAGHQVENGRAVPFYQFRHLTFQEYLAALAIVEGHYDGYDSKSSILKVIKPRLVSDEWKEVVPMTAVLARKRADPLIRELVNKGAVLKRKMDSGKGFSGKKEWLSHPNSLPAAIARLVQSLIEEAEASPETLTEALSLVTYFAKGCKSAVDWKALCRGPYAGELLHQAWLLYKNLDTPVDAWVRNSYACFAAFRNIRDYWFSSAGQKEINDLLVDTSEEKVCLGLMTAVGVLWNSGVRRSNNNIVGKQMAAQLEVLLFSDSKAIAHVALWTWGLNVHYKGVAEGVSEKVLNFLLDSYLKLDLSVRHSLFSFALHGCIGLQRNSWSPILSDEEVARIRSISSPLVLDGRSQHASAALTVAFHSGRIWSDSELVSRIIDFRDLSVKFNIKRDWERFDNMLAQIHPFGTDYLLRLAEKEALEDESTMDELVDDLESFEESSDSQAIAI
ncbi:SIR2 family protein [Pseudomonas sp. B2M1-30]|uniref:SIR2 family protein n=1 Tax=Pseudomonas TaxID=286 RepID=UPI0021CA239E|nr:MULTISPECIES: SIR2 family protein [Pseudomonas]MCU0118570.1 SIR2 family protein [Pseudomonas sp. B2M1-30]MCU7263162.1 SIR2 family protein [Pseudomonas koreensis]